MKFIIEHSSKTDRRFWDGKDKWVALAEAKRYTLNQLPADLDGRYNKYVMEVPEVEEGQEKKGKLHKLPEEGRITYIGPKGARASITKLDTP